MREIRTCIAILAAAFGAAGCTEPLDLGSWSHEGTERTVEEPEAVLQCAEDPSKFVPESISEDSTCALWLGKTERSLCRATAYFNSATKLESQAAVSWSARLTYFRKAVEHLVDVLFESRSLTQVNYWMRAEQEQNLATLLYSSEGACVTKQSNPDNVDELLYFRQLKVQAVELYRRVAEYYTYALVAAADASRAVSGNTAERSDRVWGSDVSDPLVQFLDLKGNRGAATAFLLGTDAWVLDDLVKRAGNSEFTSVEFACVPTPNNEPGLFEEADCNARMVTPLPHCRYAVRSEPIDRARQLLQRHGVPLGTQGGHVTDGEDLGGFVMARLNQRLDLDGLPLHTDLDALLDELPACSTPSLS